jgi:hypothetical protein
MMMLRLAACSGYSKLAYHRAWPREQAKRSGSRAKFVVGIGGAVSDTRSEGVRFMTLGITRRQVS